MCSTKAAGDGGGKALVQPTDLDLIRRAAGQDQQAFAVLVGRYAQSLYRLAYVMVGSAADAEDVLQETLVGAYRGLANFEERSSVKTWLSRILVRQAAHLLRSRKTRRGRLTKSMDGPVAPPSDDPGMASGPGDEAVRRKMDVAAALKTLSPEHREIILLREFQGLAYEEIAQVLDVPRGTVDSRLSRARRELQQRLKDYETTDAASLNGQRGRYKAAGVGGDALEK